MPKLVEPLREAGRQAAAASRASHLLVAHDWSFLSFPTHASMAHRVSQNGKEGARG